MITPQSKKTYKHIDRVNKGKIELDRQTIDRRAHTDVVHNSIEI